MQTKIVTHEVRDENHGTLHFETLFQGEAERFIRDYDSDHGVVLELYETDRAPVDHTKK